MSKKTYCYFNILVIRLVLNLMQINFAHIIQKEKNYISFTRDDRKTLSDIF